MDRCRAGRLATGHEEEEEEGDEKEEEQEKEQDQGGGPGAAEWCTWGAHLREWAVDRQHLAAFEDMNARGKRALQALGM